MVAEIERNNPLNIADIQAVVAKSQKEQADISSKKLELDTVLATLRAIKQESSATGAAASESLVIALGNHARSLAASLPPEIGAKVLSAIDSAATVARAAVERAERQEREQREKLDSAGHVAIYVPVSYIPASITNADDRKTVSFFGDILQKTEPNRLSVAEKEALVSTVFTPEETASFLVRSTTVDATHSLLLTDYSKYPEGTLPPVTKNMIDDFRDASKNQALADQCSTVLAHYGYDARNPNYKALQAKIQVAEEATKSGVDIGADSTQDIKIAKLIIETRNTQQIAETAIHKEDVIGLIKTLVADAKTQDLLKEKTSVKETGIEEVDIGRLLLQSMRETKLSTKWTDKIQDKGGTGGPSL